MSTAPPSPRTAAALVALVQFALMWTAFFVLHPSLGWPESLQLPAADQLGLIAARPTPALVGYGLYTISALLLIPLAVLFRRALALEGAWGDLSVALGVSAGVVKAVALSRWLLLAPTLAAAAAVPDASGATAVALFGAIDALGGGLGEVLGIGVLSAGWTATVAAALLSRRAGGAAPLGVGGLLAAALLALSVPAGFGAGFGPVLMVSGIGWQCWLAAAAVWLLRRTEATAAPAAPAPSPALPARPLPHRALAGAALGLALAAPAAHAQEAPRSTFAEVGIGLGKSEFYGRLEAGDELRDAQGFSPNLGGTLAIAFYQRAGWASPRLYLGGRFKVHIATPTSGDGPEEYFFNHYYGGLSARYYPFSEQRAGPYAQVDLTYGQFTEKLRNTSADRADHQFAVGPGVFGAVGYAVPVGGVRRLSLQLYVQRNVGSGDVDGEGEVGFDYGALGAEILIGF